MAKYEGNQRERERDRSYRAVVRWAVEMQRLEGLLEVSDEHGVSVPAPVLSVGGLSSMKATRD